MTSVLVDPQRKDRQGGPRARWGAVIDAAGQFGLAPLAGSSRDVGVTGYTLGGGVGWLARKYGFAADSVIRAEVVTADGRVVTASADEHPDLFWAIRGGTGNFGIVTSLEFRLYSVPQVHAGIVYFGIDSAAETLKFVPRLDRHDPQRAEHRDRPDPHPRHRQPRARDQGPRTPVKPTWPSTCCKPLFEVAGPVLAGELKTTPFADSAMGGTPARYLDLVDTLADDLLDELVSARAPTVEIRHWSGAMAHPGPGAGPVGHRDAPYSLIIDQEVPELAPRTAHHGSHVRELPRRPGRARPRRTPKRTSAACARSSAPTTRTNFFHLNHNIKPLTARPERHNGPASSLEAGPLLRVIQTVPELP